MNTIHIANNHYKKLPMETKTPSDSRQTKSAPSEAIVHSAHAVLAETKFELTLASCLIATTNAFRLSNHSSGRKHSAVTPYA
jgi:hypothetical protein